MSPAMVTPEGVVVGGGPRFVPGSASTAGPVTLSPVFIRVAVDHLRDAGLLAER